MMAPLRRSTVCALIAVALCASLIDPLNGRYPGAQAASPPPEAKSAGAGFADLKAKLTKAQKKGRAADEADALYDLAKAYFERGDLAEAEEHMRRSLAREELLKRPQSGIRTRVALAAILAAARKNAAARDAYEAALEFAQSHDMPDQAAAIVDSLGAMALVSGKTDEAERLFSKARELAIQSGTAESRCKALINLAVVARARSQYTQALAHLSEALSVLARNPDDEIEAAVLTEQGACQAEAGKTEEALASYRRAAELYEGQLDVVCQARALVATAPLLIKQGSAQRALEAIAQADELLSKQGADSEKTDCLIARGSALVDLGQYDEAQATYRQALALAQGAHDHRRSCAVFTEMGYGYLLRGLAEKALESFQEALKLASVPEHANAKVKAVLLTDIAICFKALGQTAAAIKQYEQAVAEFEAAGDRAGKAMAFNSLAVAYLDSGNYAEFERYAGEAKALFVALNDSYGQGLIAYNVAQHKLVEGQHAEAVELYEEALKDMRAARYKRGEGQVLRGLGLAYLCLNRPGKALECYQEATPLAEATGSIEAMWDCALGKGKALKAMGQTERACAELTASVDLVEKERSQLSKDVFKTFNLDLRQDCFAELIDALVKSNKAAQALEIAERGRARAFLDLLEGRGARGLSEAAVKSGQKEEEEVAEIRTAGAAEAGTRAVQLVPRISATVEASTISPINALPPTLDEIKKIVARSGSTFLEYYVVPDKVYMWVVYPDGRIELAPPVMITAKELADKIAKAYKAITAQPKAPSDLPRLSAAREQHLKTLYELLVAPALPLLPKSADSVVTVVPHGPIFSVPFAALTDSEGKFLIERCTLAYVPAIAVLRATQKLKEELSGVPDRLLALGNPITKAIAFLGTLPYAEKEVKHVCEIFGAERSTVLTGESASKAAFRELAPKASFIHLATHGLIDEQRPMRSALVLAPAGGDDGLLTVKDILQLPPLKAKMIALSACQTGRGKITGDGVVGLSRSFIIAGTPSILVSQWNVDDVMTEYQMVSFYKSLLAGASRARALRDAQLETIAFLERSTGKGATPTQIARRRANPRYWAAFQLIGESGR